MYIWVSVRNFQAHGTSKMSSMLLALGLGLGVIVTITVRVRAMDGSGLGLRYGLVLLN